MSVANQGRLETQPQGQDVLLTAVRFTWEFAQIAT